MSCLHQHTHYNAVTKNVQCDDCQQLWTPFVKLTEREVVPASVPEPFLTERNGQESTTTDGKPPAPGTENTGAPQPIDPKTGQHGAYWVLSAAERAKGFVRPVRDTYTHVKGCGSNTTMGIALAETYARDPSYYGSTFCCACGRHFPVAEFVWRGTDERVGS
jgi:hypothetical protein